VTIAKCTAQSFDCVLAMTHMVTNTLSIFILTKIILPCA